MNQRKLTKQEKMAWNEYNRVLCAIPNYNKFDRVSLMKAFPDLQRKFDNVASISLKVIGQMEKYIMSYNQREEFSDFVSTVVSGMDELTEVENWLTENNIDSYRVMHSSGSFGIEGHWYMPEERERVAFFLKWGKKTVDWSK